MRDLVIVQVQGISPIVEMTSACRADTRRSGKEEQRRYAQVKKLKNIRLHVGEVFII